MDLSERPFALWTDESATEPAVFARALIVATGPRSLMLGVPGEDRLLGYGVSTCATCDGFFFREQEIGVVGGGDSAIEEAIFLTRFASKVTLIHRRKELRASKIMQDHHEFANEKIEFRWDSVVTGVVGEQKLSGVEVKSVTTGATEVLPLTGLFVVMGHSRAPPSSRASDMDDAGYLVSTDGTHTNVEGVFASGDAQDHVYRQAVTAAGSGCMAAIDAERWLESQEHE